MRGTARIMRIVDHAGDARIDAADGRQIVADIMILRPIGLGEGPMRRVPVVGERRRVGIDAAKLVFPGMTAAIDEARHDDSVVRVDHLRIGGARIGYDGGDLLAFDQPVARGEIADLGVHADDGAALHQYAMLGIDRALALEMTHGFGVGRIGSTATTRTAGPPRQRRHLLAARRGDKSSRGKRAPCGRAPICRPIFGGDREETQSAASETACG